MSNLIRKYKMHQITPCLTDKELENINYIKDIFDNTIPYNPNNHGLYTHYMNKQGKCIYRTRTITLSNSISEIGVTYEVWDTLINYLIDINKNDKNNENIIKDNLRYYVKNNKCDIRIISGTIREYIEEKYKIDKL